MKYIYSSLILFSVFMLSSNRDSFDYKTAWKEVDDLLNKEALPQSALNKVNSIYKRALDEKNYQYVLKALSTKISLTYELDENSWSSAINLLKAEVEVLPSPVKSVGYSLIADAYWKFYQSNSWRFYQRTNSTVVPDDINTWSIDMLGKEIIRYYLLSVEKENELQKELTRNYLILEKNENDIWRPSLYDYLMGRAIDVLSQGEITQISPVDEFTINNKQYFAGVNEFIAFTPKYIDEGSTSYQVFRLYQKWLKYNIQKNDINALVDADLNRLEYVRNNCDVSEKEEWYESGLKQLIDAYFQSSITGDVYYKLAYLYYEQGESYRSGNEKYRNHYVKALEIAERIKLLYSNSTAAKYCDALVSEIKKPAFSFNSEDYLIKGVNKALLEYRNLERVYLSVYKLKLEEYILLDKRDQEYEKYIEKERRVLHKEIKLPSRHDFQKYSLEFPIDPLEFGCYLLVVSETETPNIEEKINCAKLVQVSNLATLGQITNWTVNQALSVRDRISGIPTEGATINVYSSRNYSSPDTLLKSYISSKEGIVNIEKDEFNRISCLKIEKGKDLLFQNYNNYRNFSSESIKQPEVIFFTDRAIYRPGQTVYFKALLIDKNGKDPKILPNYSLEVNFYDANNQQVSILRLQTNEFGSANGSFIIPQGRLNGQMRIAALNNSAFFGVEEYKRPSFEVKINAPTTDSKLNTEVSLTGEAKSFAGYAVDNAQVEYRVIRKSFFPYRYFGFHFIQDAEKDIASGNISTDKAGNFEVTFETKADENSNDKLIYQYILSVDVTDANGETQSSSFTLLASEKSLLIRTDIPDKIRNKDSLLFELSTTNLNGKDIESEIDIEIAELKLPNKLLRTSLWQAADTFLLSRSEFEKLFPMDIYTADDNDPTKYDIERILETKKQKTSETKKLDLTVLKKSKATWYKVKVSARSTQGTVIESSYYLKYTGKDVAITQMEDWVQAINTKVERGGNAEFWLAGAPNAYIRYSLINEENKIFSEGSIKAGPVPYRLLIPVLENTRGFVVQFNLVQNNRLYSSVHKVEVLREDKKLSIQFNTFREQLLPGEQEKWSISVKDGKGTKQLSELVASLYDASLDSFIKNTWTELNDIYQIHLPEVTNYSGNLNVTYNNLSRNYSYTYAPNIQRTYPSLYLNFESLIKKKLASPVYAGRSAGVGVADYDENFESREMGISQEARSNRSIENKEDEVLEKVEVRTNFNETAFFYPELRTNEQGEIILEFTIPEALTRWRLLGFAHTKDLKIGSIKKELVTRKQVAISANAPRFLREGDKVLFTAKVNNITDKKLTINTLLQLFDPVKGKEINSIIESANKEMIEVNAQESKVVSWELNIPEGLQALTYRVSAQAEDHRDGEEKTIPVLSNKLLVTESMPFTLRANQKKSFTFDRMNSLKSKSLRNYSYTLEFTSNPVWYAVQSLPYMMEYPYQCSEQNFSRFYANSIALSLLESTPRIKKVFDLWKNLPQGDALQSQLQKNQELKQALLEETPWVMQAGDEVEQKKRIALLFDLNRMGNEMDKTVQLLQNVQYDDGGFPWFEGLRPNRFVTQHIVSGIAHLNKLNAVSYEYKSSLKKIVKKAFVFLDKEIVKDYLVLKKDSTNFTKKQVGSIHLHYLFSSANFKHQPDNSEGEEAYNYFYKQAEKYWTQFSIYEQGLIAITMHLNGNIEIANKIVRSLKERAKQSEELGMYWTENRSGYFWNQAPIETQALMIEVFSEIANDSKAVEDLKIWLLRNKQTTHWGTTKATSEAIYALLSTDKKVLASNETLEIKLGGKSLNELKPNLKPEPGTDYVKTSWLNEEINPSMATIQISNPNEGIAWGAMYWQYFEQIDKITSSATNLKIRKELFIKTNTQKGPILNPVSSQEVKVGDVLTVRIELRADRDFEYVHLKDSRASGLEPVSTLSGYRFRQGLGYYENIKDASMNFFIDYLPQGTYVFEYDLRVTHSGDYSNGISTFQCMYAPEFNAHSQGERIKINSNK